MADVAAVRAVLIEALELDDWARGMGPESALFGSIPELDSLGVLRLVTALEEKFDIRFEDEEFEAQLFETLGILSDFVDMKVRLRDSSPTS